MKLDNNDTSICLVCNCFQAVTIEPSQNRNELFLIDDTSICIIAVVVSVWFKALKHNCQISTCDITEALNQWVLICVFLVSISNLSTIKKVIIQQIIDLCCDDPLLLL